MKKTSLGWPVVIEETIRGTDRKRRLILAAVTDNGVYIIYPYPDAIDNQIHNMFTFQPTPTPQELYRRIGNFHFNRAVDGRPIDVQFLRTSQPNPLLFEYQIDPKQYIQYVISLQYSPWQMPEGMTKQQVDTIESFLRNWVVIIS